MKILHVTPFYYPYEGGGERYVRRVSECLLARGHQVRVLTTNALCERNLTHPENGRLPESQAIGGIDVTRVPVTPGTAIAALKAWERLRGGYRSLSYLFTASGLEMLLGKPPNLNFFWSTLREDADVVVTWNWYHPPAYHAYLARRFKRSVQVGVPLFHTNEPWVQRPIYDHMIRACDGMIVCTAHEKDFILDRVPSARRIIPIGPGIDVNVFAARDGARFRKHHGLGQSPLVGYVGSMRPGKGGDALVEAMPLVWKWNKDVRLVLAGYRSHDFPRLDQLLRDLPPSEQERISILPNLTEDEKVNLCDALDVFALPSTSESFGIAYLEAWMCRKPVIGCRIASTACVIQDGVDGLLANPDDPGDLAAAIRALLSNPDRRAQMGARGHAKTVTHFTWERIGEKFERFCSDLIAERQRDSRNVA